jgi:uncharacterized membrane protein HdeD (DUF308 family)
MEKDWLVLGWKVLVLRGVLGIVFGIVAIAWPISTATALALLWGIWALVEGLGSLWQAFQPGATGRVWLVVMGVIALVAAFFAIFHAGATAVALTWILGIWLIVRGIFELVGAFASTLPMPRWLLVLGGLLSILVGVLFTANPGAGAVAVAVWLGLMALIWGIVLVATGFMFRQGAKASAASGPGHTPSAPPSPA